MIKRLGLFGGMFDPVHNGHLDAARFAQAELALDSLRLVPCATPNHRDSARVAGKHRLQMLRLAIADEEGMVADDIELTRPGVSYSVDTLTQVREQVITEHIVFILGLDAFCSLTKWHNWQQMFELCHLFILGRAGNRIDSATLSATEFAQRQVNTAEEMFASSHGKILLAEEFSYEASSSAVRKALRMHDDVSPLLHPKVQLYIEDNRLYR
ncbi:MAG: nicotinate-nucleotide adenylyltransferase [Gammaproteobacteria bacterium]